MPQDQDLIQFQSRNLNHLGKPLLQDGVLGPQTRWALAVDNLPRYRRAAIHKALECVGITENPPGSNRGPDIDFWLKRCGVPVPQDPKEPAPKNAWCAAVQSWILSMINELEFKFARVYDWVHKSGLKAIGIEQVQAADLGLILRPDGTGHIWMVAGKQMGEKGWITMNLEGNTGNAFRTTLRDHTTRTMYLQTFGQQPAPGIIESVPYAGQSTR